MLVCSKIKCNIQQKILGRISLTEENASIELLDVDFPLHIFLTKTGAVKENKKIRLLISEADTVDMNGLGYPMLREEVDQDTFSLKVLAQDTDFDLYLLNSWHSNAYNLKKMGAFYPLNDIPAVEEYLDACFPYLKEIATNEEGDIWMIPIELNILCSFI